MIMLLGLSLLINEEVRNLIGQIVSIEYYKSLSHSLEYYNSICLC